MTKTTKPAELAGDAMDDVTLDTLLAKEPVKELSDDELVALVKRQREDRAAWLLKQTKKGKEE